MSWCVLLEYVKDNYTARFHDPLFVLFGLRLYVPVVCGTVSSMLSGPLDLTH